MLLDFNFQLGVRLYRMMCNCPNIRKSVLGFMKRAISMIHAESYNPTTVEFLSLSPAGEEHKIVVILDKAEYMQEAMKIPEVSPNESSYQLTGFVDSLYKAIVGYNGAIEGFLKYCPGLATVTYAIARHIYLQWYGHRQKDIAAEIIWDCHDMYETEDLLIVGTINA